MIPQGETGEKRSFALSMKGLVSIFAGLVGAVLIVVVLLLAYTPLGLIVPVSNTEIQRRYGSQLFDLQSRLTKLSEEVIVIREYNRKLRSALGQDFAADTTTASLPDTPDEQTPAQTKPEVETHQQQAAVEQPRSENTSYGFAPPPQVTSKAFQATFPMYPPVLGYVSRGFDEAKKHFGIDYAGRRGSIISAAAEGYVVFSGWTFDDGNMVILSHGGGYFTIYKHCQSLLRSPNEFVKRGQPIALLGNSGNTSYGPHLHFELWKDGQPQNPDDYLVANESM